MRGRQRLRFQQKSNVVWRGPPGWSFTYLCHRCYDKVAYPSRYDTSLLELSPDVGHFVYRRKRDKREVLNRIITRGTLSAILAQL